MNKFWNWVKNELYISGPIAEETWFNDEVTPELFKEELAATSGDIVVWINSPGGDCLAASRIYTMLLEHQGNVTIKIDGLAASAASVIAMAGTEVLMSPTAVMMIHNPLTMAWGNTKDMEKAIALLDEIKESIINAYELKTGLRRSKISELMDAETWMNARSAMEYGFCDGIIGQDSSDTDSANTTAMLFSTRTVNMALTNKISASLTPSVPKKDPGHPAIEVMKRLELLEH